MAYTASDLAVLEKALANPTKEIWFKGRKKTFRSAQELRDMLDYVKGELERAEGSQTRRAVVIQSD
jgi:hypothetical protein